MANRRVSIPYDVWHCLHIRFCDYGNKSVDEFVTGVLLDKIREQYWENSYNNDHFKTVLNNHGIKPIGEK